jgi:Co/Zn/Cd efflux system component
VRLVALLNLAYFGVEFAVALTIGSVSLFADSVDFLEDASLNLLILMALGWSARARARVGMLLAGILLVPGLATLWTAGRSSTRRCRRRPCRSRLPGRARSP